MLCRIGESDVDRWWTFRSIAVCRQRFRQRVQASFEGIDGTILISKELAQTQELVHSTFEFLRVSGHTGVGSQFEMGTGVERIEAGCFLQLLLGLDVLLNRLVRAGQLVAERRRMRIPRHGTLEIGNRLLEPRQVKQRKSRQVSSRHRFRFDLGGFRQRCERLLELPSQEMSTGEIAQREGRLRILRNRPR